jgi:hypothetical protein
MKGCRTIDEFRSVFPEWKFFGNYQFWFEFIALKDGHTYERIDSEWLKEHRSE